MRGEAGGEKPGERAGEKRGKKPGDDRPLQQSGPSTRAVHAGGAAPAPDAPLVTPITESATFYNEPVPTKEVLYTRYGTNPNQRVVAEKIAALEGAEAALVVGSGMAACSLALLAFVGSGDHVVAARALYGGTVRLLQRELPRLGVAVTLVGDRESWRRAIQAKTRAILVEVPSNPLLRVVDIRALAKIARERGIPLLVDATFATPINLRPLEHGADLVIHSGTKYLGGHSDVTAGAVAGPAVVIDEIREKLKSFGPNLDPHAAWLLERGLKTLALRVERQNENALAIARWLEGHPAIETVHYPGLESHPDHRVASELLDGYGGMLSVVVKGGDEAALRVLDRFRLVRVAPSLGGVETLVSMPRFTSHASATPEERRALGIQDGFLRFSFGIEDAEDLRADLEQALGPEGV
ncbi:MAG: aminotransferase class I/II-fold pyridoxal phosphate-dependent enzyme [Gemmatimonadetes bacterium]|nr:aminotransferase class I/II-fold pyridoxal phosphate-dependent enzyme [Gemmatimonadota bacterium]